MKWEERLNQIAEELHKAESCLLYLTKLLASIDEINKIQEERGLRGDKWKIKPHWFPSTSTIHAYKFYELLRNLHLIRLPQLVPITEQVIRWIESGEITF